MPVLSEGIHQGEFLISEANGSRSRETVTVTPETDRDYPSGTVLGQITVGGKYVEHDPDASDGTEDAAAVLYTEVKQGTSDVSAAVIVRDAEVDLGRLTFISGIDSGDQDDAVAALVALGIQVRS